MASLTDIVVSRRKSIATLEAEVAEWNAKAAALPLGEARKAIEGIAKVKAARLVKLQGELAGLVAAAHATSSDPREVELSQVVKAGQKR